jgi:hypothetical protein
MAVIYQITNMVIEVTSNTIFSSLSAALKHYGLKMPTLRRALLTEKPLLRGPHAGLQFKYLGLTFEQMQKLLAHSPE